VLGQGFQGKGQEFEDIQAAIPVGVVETLILGAITRPIHHPEGNQVVSPQVVAVTGQQGVVEIEQGQGHAWISL